MIVRRGILSATKRSSSFNGTALPVTMPPARKAAVRACCQVIIANTEGVPLYMTDKPL